MKRIESGRNVRLQADNSRIKAAGIDNSIEMFCYDSEQQLAFQFNRLVTELEKAERELSETRSRLLSYADTALRHQDKLGELYLGANTCGILQGRAAALDMGVARLEMACRAYERTEALAKALAK